MIVSQTRIDLIRPCLSCPRIFRRQGRAAGRGPPPRQSAAFATVADEGFHEHSRLSRTHAIRDRATAGLPAVLSAEALAEVEALAEAGSAGRIPHSKGGSAASAGPPFDCIVAPQRNGVKSRAAPSRSLTGRLRALTSASATWRHSRSRSSNHCLKAPAKEES